MLCARSFNPDTEDEDESEHGEANAGEVPVRTDSEDAARLLCDAPEQRPQADQGARPVPYRQGLGGCGASVGAGILGTGDDRRVQACTGSSHVRIRLRARPSGHRQRNYVSGLGWSKASQRPQAAAVTGPGLGRCPGTFPRALSLPGKVPGPGGA